VPNQAYTCPECTNVDVAAITTKREANALFEHLVKVHARDLAEAVVSSCLDVRSMTSGPPDFRDLWTPPKSS
jgi:hypothetical protein